MVNIMEMVATYVGLQHEWVENVILIFIKKFNAPTFAKDLNGNKDKINVYNQKFYLSKIYENGN